MDDPNKVITTPVEEEESQIGFEPEKTQFGLIQPTRIVEEMEKQGVISSANHVGKRDVLVQDFSEV